MKSERDIKSVQEQMNRFVAECAHHVAPIMADGVIGPATKKRVRFVKYILGYRRQRQTPSMDHEFVQRLTHPHSPRHGGVVAVARGLKRRVAQRARADRNWKQAHNTVGVETFDGRSVASWIVPYLEWARAHGWKGWVNSGWRNPTYSESLCKQMCGRPSCPGRCAGRASNHSGSVKPHGAVDVADYITFKRLMLECPYEPKLINALPTTDPVHFSYTGR